MNNRREFIRGLLIGGAGITLAGLPINSVARELEPALGPGVADGAWSQVTRILGRVRAPVFPRRNFPITRFGARGDGRTDCTEAFAKAISACNRAGGGRVV